MQGGAKDIRRSGCGGGGGGCVAKSALLFIDGQWVRPALGKTLPVVNPHSAEEVGRIASGTEADVSAAVLAARRAFPGWAKTPGTARAAILRKMAAEVLRRKDELSALETEDCGKPLEESEWDIDDVAACFEYFAERAEKLCDPGSGSISREAGASTRSFPFICST